MTEAEIFEFFHNLGIVPVVKIDDASKAEKLAEAAREFHEDVTPKESIESAVEEAFAQAEPEDVILAFGSLSFIGQLSDIVMGMSACADITNK